MRNINLIEFISSATEHTQLKSNGADFMAQWLAKWSFLGLVIGLMLVFAPAVNAGGLEKGVERPGKTYRKVHLRRPDPMLCQDACWDDPLCQAFTFYRPGMKGKGADCDLKNHVPKSRPRGGCVSGVKPRGHHRPPAPKPEQHRPPKHGRDSNDDSPGFRSNMSIEYNTELPGKTYNKIALRRPEPASCEQMCQNDPLCAAFTYWSPGMRGKKAVCHLKSVVPQRKHRQGCISGVKPRHGDHRPGPGKPRPLHPKKSW